jgi:mannose-6-phosphate isomerase
MQGENMLNKESQIYSRPWGYYQTLKLFENSQVKWILVKPNEKLSLQKHLKRSEHWIIIKGTPMITINNSTKTYFENEHAFIPKESIHRIENKTDEEVIIVEVQIGSYLGEDDIIRLDDKYNRELTNK